MSYGTRLVLSSYTIQQRLLAVHGLGPSEQDTCLALLRFNCRLFLCLVFSSYSVRYMPESSVSIETMSLTIASNAMLQDAVVTQLSTHKINTNPFCLLFSKCCSPTSATSHGGCSFCFDVRCLFFRNFVLEIP